MNEALKSLQFTTQVMQRDALGSRGVITVICAMVKRNKLFCLSCFEEAINTSGIHVATLSSIPMYHVFCMASIFLRYTHMPRSKLHKIFTFCGALFTIELDPDSCLAVESLNLSFIH